MPNEILTLIKDNAAPEVIQKYLTTHPKIPLFTPLVELKNKSLYDHLKLYGKLHYWPLDKFIHYKAIDFHERNAEGKSLVQLIIESDSLYLFQRLLYAGEKPTEDMLLVSAGTTIGKFLNYRPGKNNPSVYEISSKRVPDIEGIYNLMFDFYDTSSDESSEAEISDTEELSVEDAQAFKNNQFQLINEYNINRAGADNIKFIAARGVHFVEKYFPAETRQLIRDSRKVPHTTYSASTLFDSGYEADDEPEENDATMLQTHRRNLTFVDSLKNTPDRKEKKSEHYNPPATRNKKVFESLYWRHIQCYINSYNSLFNFNGIQINFSFASTNNPHLSLSWKTEVAGLYGGGVRFGWKKGQRRDPHYRRYDGKPKHPNIGYIDVFELPMDYVRFNGVDRLLAYNQRHIDLSNLHLSEAEVIFHSLIPKSFHAKRYMIVLPSFAGKGFKKNIDDKYFGMAGKSSYTRAKNDFFATTNGKKKDQKYQEWVTKRTQHAVTAQSTLIDKETDVRLFKSGKVRAFDHGYSIQDFLPSPQR